MIKLITTAGIVLLGLSYAANAQDQYEQSLERFGTLFTHCVLEDETPDSATDQKAVDDIMESMMASIKDTMRTNLIEANADPVELSACMDTLEAAGCAALDSEEPPAGCEILNRKID